MTRPWATVALALAGAFVGSLGGCATEGSAYGSGAASSFSFMVNYDGGRKNWLAAAGDGKLVVQAGSFREVIVEPIPPTAHIEAAWRGEDELEVRIVRDGGKSAALLWSGMMIDYAHRGLSVEKVGTYRIDADDGRLVRFEPAVAPKAN